MKSRLTVLLVGLSILIAAVPFAQGGQAGPEALIGRARAVVLSPHFSRDEINKALADVLEASLLVLPKTDQNKDVRSRIESAKSLMQKGEIFSGKAREGLAAAYTSTAGGRVWQVPAELTAEGSANKGIETATKICAKLLDSALGAYKAGRSDEAVRDLLGMVILVVTPIERSR
jgi:hypothetical protein